MKNHSVQYRFENGVAEIRIDDGKRNALSPAVLEELYAAFDRAESDRAVVILTGRDDVFSAGFDLKVLRGGGLRAIRMLRLGYRLTARVMSYPYPVITACNGHVLAMGVFLMLSTDYVIGTRGEFRVAANEVAIGLTMPRVAAAVLQHRLTPAAAQRAITLSEYFDTDAAVEAGFFDELQESDKLMHRARQQANQFRELDTRAHAATKRRIRKSTIRQIRYSVWLDLWDAAMIGVRAAFRSAR